MTSKIYKIIPVCEYEEGDVYYGSTTQIYLCGRMSNHRQTYKKWKNNEYHFITCFELFDKYGIENCKIELVEELNNITREELLLRERYYIENFKCINKDRPIITKEEVKIYKAEYHQQNKNNDEYKEKRKIYNDKYNEKVKLIKIKCDCGIEYCIRKKNRHLQSPSHILKIKLQTDEEFRKAFEENKKKEDDDRIERVKEYKKEWHKNKNTKDLENV